MDFNIDHMYRELMEEVNSFHELSSSEAEEIDQDEEIIQNNEVAIQSEPLIPTVYFEDIKPGILFVNTIQK